MLRPHDSRRNHRSLSDEYPGNRQQKGNIDMTTGWILMTVFLDTGISAIVAGVAFLVAWPLDDGVPHITSPQQARVVTSIESTAEYAMEAATA
jgi:hypothetical protein